MSGEWVEGWLIDQVVKEVVGWIGWVSDLKCLVVVNDGEHTVVNQIHYLSWSRILDT